MSKVLFRARALDANRILPIYQEEELVDLNECNSINRTVPQMPTGMEKDEESELHLQEALSAWQRDKTTEYVAIPIPEIQSVEKRYLDCYPESFQISKQFFNMQPILLADEETIDYDMDSEDEECLNNLRGRDKDITDLQFEAIMDKLEKSSSFKVVSLNEASLLMREVEKEFLILVYDFWLNKRLKYKSPLILGVKPERRDGGSANDPYVAFRKRTEKMQTRKNRKNDIQSFEKMLTLRLHFLKLMDILMMINKRELLKRQSISTRQMIYTARVKASDWDGSCLAQADLKAGKSHSHNLRHVPAASGWKEDEMPEKDDQIRRKRDARKRRNRAGRPRLTAPVNSTTNANADSSGDDSSAESTSDPDGQFNFKRMPGCHYYAVADTTASDFREARKHNGLSWKGSFYLTSLPNVIHPKRASITGYLRQRVGRGGRRLFDRRPAQSSNDDAYLAHWDKVHCRFSRKASFCGYSSKVETDSSSPVEEDWTVDDTQVCFPQLCHLPAKPFYLKDNPDHLHDCNMTPLPLSASPRHSNNSHSLTQRAFDPRPQSHPSIRPHQSTIRPREPIDNSSTAPLVRHKPSPVMARSSYAFTSTKKEGATTRVIVTSPPNNSLARVGTTIRINGANPISRMNEMRPPNDGPVTYMVVRSSSSGSSATPASNVAGTGPPPRKLLKVPSGAPSSGSSQASSGVGSQQQRAGIFTPRANNAIHSVMQRGIPGRGNKRKRIDFMPGMTSDGDD